MFFTKENQQDNIAENVDEYNDSYTRNTTVEELKAVLEDMKLDRAIDTEATSQLSARLFAQTQEEHAPLPGWIFKGLTLYFHSPESPSALNSSNSDISQRLQLARSLAEFGSANISETLETGQSKKKDTKTGITHIVVPSSLSPREGEEELVSLRKTLSKLVSSSGYKLPHIVSVGWVEQSWKEKTLLDEESMFSFLFFSLSFY
jgi:DNA ligase-4